MKRKVKATKKKATAKKKTRKSRPRGMTKSNTPELSSKEKFICNLVVEAKLPKRIAMIEAGLSPINTTRFFKRANINAYIEAKRAVKVAVNKHRQGMIIAELQKIAFANLGEYLEFGPSGVTIKSSKNLTDDQKAALSEVAETLNATSQNTKIKLHDKTKALETLAKIEGMLIDRHKVGGDEDNPAPIKFILGNKNLKPPEKS